VIALRRDDPAAADQGNQTLGMPRQQLAIDPGLVVEPLEVARRHEAKQVAVPRRVLGQQHEVVEVAVCLPLAIEAGAGSDVELAADDGVDLSLATRGIEGHDAVHGPVIGEGKGAHAELRRLVHQALDPAGAVQQAVFRMHVQMHEGRSTHGRTTFRHDSTRAIGCKRG
jgi:hypothetical protein